MSGYFAGDIDRAAQADLEDYHSYKAISPLSVVSLGLALLSVLTFLEWIFFAVPVLGVILGIAACLQISRRRHELTGLPLAGTGVILSAAMMVFGLGWHVYVYHTEVPPGYTRINYDRLRPAAGDPGWQRGVVSPPPEMVALDGKKVFVKGYMYPSQHRQVKEFVLCRDNKDCCFGGQPSPTDMILVTMKNPSVAQFSSWQRKVGGTFRVKAAQRDADQGVVHQIIYQLEADYLP